MHDRDRIELRYIVMPEDTNPHGLVFGGKIVCWLDLAAAMIAERYSKMTVATVSIDNVSFVHPIKLGHHVLIKARIISVGRTSIKIEGLAYMEDPFKSTQKLATKSTLTFVALKDGKPCSVPKL